MLVALAFGIGTFGAAGQPSIHWRVYRGAEGLPESACRFVTVGGAGDVFVRGLKTGAVARFDGYAWSKIDTLPDDCGPVFESPASQFWAVSPSGLCQWTAEAWRIRPVEAIAAAHRASTDLSIPLCPVRQNVVLFLLPDGLMEFSVDETGKAGVRVLRNASQTELGRFTGMRVAPDDGLWISGERGLAKISGPKRAINESSTWRQFVCPESVGARYFRQPQCADDDSVVCVANADGEDRKCVVRFDGRNWQATSAGATNIQFAWLGPDGALWAAAPDALLHFGGASASMEDEPAPSAIFDVAVGAHGMFWLATSEGVFCRLPQTWQLDANPPAGLFSPAPRETFAESSPAPRDAVAIVHLPEGKIWCATAEKVWAFDGLNWATIRGGIGRINAMIRSSDGGVWVASSEGLHRYIRGNWIDIGVEDGLPTAMARDVREDASARIWAATPRGIVVNHPEGDLDAPRAVIHEGDERGQDVPQGGTLTVSFGGRDKWNMTPPGRLLFSWRLDDRDWSPFDTATTATFSDLAPGKRYFEVRAMDRNGNVQGQPARTEFGVILPWYKEERLVWIACGGALAALFFAGLALKRHLDLVHSYAEVERQVAERTAELKIANQELLHSQKMTALGTLAAGIAHDFNNILSIIKGSAQIIERNPNNPEKILARTERIKTVVDQGASVVQAMLGFSRNSDEAVETCDANAIVDNTLRLLGDRFLRETDVRFDRAGGSPLVKVSQGLVQQILLNFIFNAAESMTGRKVIGISTSASARLPGGIALSPGRAALFVCIAVRDCGCGIAPEALPRVFEPFFTTKALSSRRGTGLGLSVAYELAQKIGAGLAVESNVGAGSVFTLILPAAPVPAPDAVPA